jgi:hypothetical protein
MVFNKMAAKTIWKPDTKSVQKMTIGKPDGPVFGGVLYSNIFHDIKWVFAGAG